MRKGEQIKLRSGKVVEIVAFIGEGGFGTVWKGKFLEGGKLVAVKFLPPHATATPEALQSFRNEVDIARRVDHPNVVHLIDALDGTGDRGPVVVWEFVAGGDLRADLKRRKQKNLQFELGAALSALRDIASGLAKLNVEHHVIHRDIKPENLLIDESGVKIADLGIAKITDEATRAVTLRSFGAGAYCAPERFNPKAKDDKVDVYSAGIVFYQILTLRHPLQDAVADSDDPMAWQGAHQDAPRPDVRELRPEIPEDLAGVLRGMIDPNPQNRPDWGVVSDVLARHAPPRPLGPAPDRSKFSDLIAAAAGAKDRVERAQKAEEERLQAAREFHKAWSPRLAKAVSSWIEDYNACAPEELRITEAAKIYGSILTYRLPHGRMLTCCVRELVDPPLRIFSQRASNQWEFVSRVIGEVAVLRISGYQHLSEVGFNILVLEPREDLQHPIIGVANLRCPIPGLPGRPVPDVSNWVKGGLSDKDRKNYERTPLRSDAIEKDLDACLRTLLTAAFRTQE